MMWIAEGQNYHIFPVLRQFSWVFILNIFGILLKYFRSISLTPFHKRACRTLLGPQFTLASVSLFPKKFKRSIVSVDPRAQISPVGC